MKSEQGAGNLIPFILNETLRYNGFRDRKVQLLLQFHDFPPLYRLKVYSFERKVNHIISFNNEYTIEKGKVGNFDENCPYITQHNKSYVMLCYVQPKGHFFFLNTSHISLMSFLEILPSFKVHSVRKNRR